MKEQKAVIITLFGSVALVVLLFWAFYQTLQVPESRSEAIPEKAVMAQARL
jgi:hypothetical protein